MHSPKSIAFFLGSGPTSQKTAFALQLADKFHDDGCRVSFFLMGEGIYNALSGVSVKNVHKQVQHLAERGVEFSVCVNMAKARGITSKNIADWVNIESLVVFSELVTHSDVLVTVNP